jgi:ATP-binding cassette subfamily C protein CydD
VLAAALLAKMPVWTAARSSGALSAVLVEQVEALEGYLVRYLPAMLQATILPLAFAAILFRTDWMVGLLLILTVPLIPLFMALAGWGAEAASKQQAEALSRLSGRFADRLRGLVTLKLFGRIEAETEAVADASEQLRLRTMKVMGVAFLSSAVLEFFAALGVAGVALYIGLTFLGLVHLRGEVPLPLEAGLFCLLMAPEVYAPLRLLAAHYHDRAAAKAAVDEIATQFDELPATGSRVDNAAPVASPAGPLSLRLVDVNIATPSGTPVITGAAVELGPGRSIAILGASGVGKSTLLEAIAGLRAFSGDIKIGERRLGEIPEAELRASVAMLGQRPRIFAGSIADNIRLGRRDACQTAVRLAARRAAVTDFADLLPDKLNTVLGEDGLGLSGGEIQRVALARLYLRDPGLLLLDEPTAHLDTSTEARVIDGLLDFARGRTLVVVTHSAAVAARMQHVMRLAGGRLLPAIRPPLPFPQRRGAA